MEAVNDLGTKSWLSSEERRCGRPDKVDKRTHAVVRYSGARPCKHLYTSKASLYVIRCGKFAQCVVHGCRDWRTAGQREHEPGSRPEDTL